MYTNATLTLQARQDVFKAPFQRRWEAHFSPQDYEVSRVEMVIILGYL